MARLVKFGQYTHRDTLIANATIRLGGVDYLAVHEIRPSTSAIVSLTTTDDTWTAVATGLSGVLSWRVSEINGDSFNYAYVAAPGSNFSVGFGWVSMETDISAIYVQRNTANNITVKLETWSA